MEQAKRYVDEVIKWSKVAYNTGQRLTFSVIKRTNYRKWRIELNRLVVHGEDEFFEED